MDAAKQSAMKALGYADAIGNRGWQGGMWRLISEIEMRCENLEAAHEALEIRATGAGRRDGGHRRRAFPSAGQSSGTFGRSFDDAGIELQAARKIFMKLGATLDLQRTEDHYRT